MTAGAGLPAAIAVSRMGHRNVVLRPGLGMSTPNQGLALVAAGIAGIAMMAPTIWHREEAKEATPDYQINNETNRRGLAIMGGTLLVLGVCSYWRPLRGLGLMDSKFGRFFSVLAPLSMGVVAEILNQVVAKGKTLEELNIFPASVFSMISCGYGLFGKHFGAELKGASFGSHAWSWNRWGAWKGAVLLNGAATCAMIPLQLWYGLANGNSVEKSSLITVELSLVNLICGTLNERFIYRNFLSPASIHAILARQLLIAGEFAVYFRWWKEKGIHHETKDHTI